MKKHLLASSALVAAGCVALTSGAVAQNKPTLSVGGYLNEIVGVVLSDKSKAKRSSLDVHNDGEVHFRGAATLDNGIKITARAELEISEHTRGPVKLKTAADGTVTYGTEDLHPIGGQDIIDEVYVNVSGSFGQVRLGEDDSVGQLMVIGYSGSWATQVGQNLSFDSFEWVAPAAGSPSHVAWIGADSDGTKVSYISPRVSGLQMGFSYTPNTDEHDDFRHAGTDKNHNGFAGAANFTGKFGETGVGAAVGYQKFKAPEGSGKNDPTELAGALRVDFGPVRVAAVWVDVAKSHRIIDVGVRYKMGPNAFSLTYADSVADAKRADGKSKKRNVGMLSYARTLGAGVKWHANLLHNRTVGSTAENSGLAFSTGIALAF